MSYTVLYVLWGVLYALTAALGFITPEGVLVYVFALLAVLFFLPPWLILRKANREGKPIHNHTIRFLAIVWLAVAVMLLVLNIRSAVWPESVGNALHAALTVASAPLVCGQMPALSLFLWAILLLGSASRPSRKK